MALVLKTLEAAIKKAFDSVSDKEGKPADLRQQMAKDLAKAIDNYIKSGTVSTTVTGTCATPAGAGTITGTGTGTIS